MTHYRGHICSKQVHSKVSFCFRLVPTGLQSLSPSPVHHHQRPQWLMYGDCVPGHVNPLPALSHPRPVAGCRQIPSLTLKQLAPRDRHNIPSPSGHLLLNSQIAGGIPNNPACPSLPPNLARTRIHPFFRPEAFLGGEDGIHTSVSLHGNLWPRGVSIQRASVGDFRDSIFHAFWSDPKKLCFLPSAAGDVVGDLLPTQDRNFTKVTQSTSKKNYTSCKL